MGYVPKRTLYKLDFSQTEYAGLEVVTRSASMATLLAIMELTEEAEEASGTEALAKLDQLFSLFGGETAGRGVLVSWNVEDEDEDGGRTPVPPTKAGLLSQDSSFCITLIQMAVRELTQAPPPLLTGSGDGATSAPPGLAEASRPSSSGPRC